MMQPSNALERIPRVPIGYSCSPESKSIGSGHSETKANLRSFESVEHLEEVTRGLGWTTEYRQLKPGDFSSTVTEVEGDSWFVMGEQSSRTLEVQAGAPEGMYLLAFVKDNSGVVNGQSLRPDHVFWQSPDAEFRAIIPQGMRVRQVGILVDEFEEMVDALAPNLSVPRTGSGIVSAPPGRASKVYRELDEFLTYSPRCAPTMDETVSKVVADAITVMADASSVPVDRLLHSAAGQRAFKKARDYIDGHLGGAIRMASLCEYVGTTLRSLERLFAREIGLTPQQYLKARRLNAVHRCLLIAERDQDVTVTEIALRYGINHLGRFATEYRCYFGESPKQTLQKSA